MAKSTADNLRIVRKYQLWLKDARGLATSTVDQASASINCFEAYLRGRDFRVFHSEVARGFKRHLDGRDPGSGKPLARSTINGILRDITGFMSWLADQPGYKSKISRSDIAYLAPDRRSENARHGALHKPHPSPQAARSVVLQMPSDTVFERRDRAFMAFLLLTGSRESAAISLQLRHVDLANRCINFDGRSANTKFGKSFTTGFFPVGEEIETIFIAWVRELRESHHFSASEPLFPKTDVGVGPDGQFAARGIAREPWSSPTPAVKIFKRAFLAADQPPYSPHRIRNTLVELANQVCRGPEELKAMSQNLGHSDVLTTLMCYGAVPVGRQVQLMDRMRRRAAEQGDFSIFDDD